LNKWRAPLATCTCSKLYMVQQYPHTRLQNVVRTTETYITQTPLCEKSRFAYEKKTLGRIAYFNEHESRSRSYFTTDGQLVSQSVSQHVLMSRPLVTRYYFLSECCCLKIAVLCLWGALSDERTNMQFAVQSLNGPSRSEPVTIFYCLIWDSPPNLKGQVPVFISHRNRVAQIYPRVRGLLYVAFYDSQGYCGGILTRLHTTRTL
jgi:hypothetical protein